MMLCIGSRGSKLALQQAEWVKAQLEKQHKGLGVSLKRIKTTGDMILDVPLAQVGGKGLFVKEIEDALLRQEIDLAVHSMKDVPTFLPSGLHLGAVTDREDPRDVFISRKGKPFKDLRQGARIGTSSLRRQAQLLNARPDLQIVQLRGNLDTRLRKLTQSDPEEGLDGIILAAAGLKRMGWLDKVTEYLSFEMSLPAVGQGALGIECRSADEEVNQKLKFLNHPGTRCCLLAERAFLRRLEGGCQVPIAAHGRIEQGPTSGLASGGPKRGGIGGATAPHGTPQMNVILQLDGLVASVDGKRLIRDAVRGPLEEAENLGIKLADRLISRGAGDILKEIYSKLGTKAVQNR
jgi:hydroxymethylbilane synthase